MPTLTLQLPNMPPVEHVLKDDAVTIGRMKGNLIALDDISVSLSHAKLTRRDGDYYLKDLNSTNGTMVNGQSITEVRLRDGDRVKFGEVVGHFNLGPTPNPPAPVVTAPVAVTNPTPIQPAPQAAPSIPVSNVAPSPSSVKPVEQLQKPGNISPASSPSKTKNWYPLAFKIVGLLVVALVLWKIVFQRGATQSQDAPRNPPASTQKPVTSTDQVSASVSNPAPSPGSGLTSLMQALKSPDVAERRRAVSTLNAMHADALPAVPALREAMKDPDPEVRMWAALSLISNRVYDKAAVPILIQALRHDNPTLRQVACLSLALIPLEDSEKDPVIAALTESASSDSNADVKNAALSALKMVAHDPASAPH